MQINLVIKIIYYFVHHRFPKLFDNSAENSEIKLIAEIEKGGTFIPQTGDIPWWVYDYVISPLFGVS